eukprot:1194846-Prorocentrum_minimum.AAC.1
MWRVSAHRAVPITRALPPGVAPRTRAARGVIRPTCRALNLAHNASGRVLRREPSSAHSRSRRHHPGLTSKPSSPPNPPLHAPQAAAAGDASPEADAEV